MSDSIPPNPRDEALVNDLTRALAEAQQAIHAAVEAGLKVSVTVETIHKIGHHYPEPLVEIAVERVVKLI